MRYLIFTNTPAHVHLYRNLVGELRGAGHEVLVLGRAYGCTEELLSYYDLPYELYGGQAPSFVSLVANVPRQFATIFRRVREYDPDFIFGRGSYAAFAGTVNRTRTILVLDSTPVNIGPMLSSRFVERVLTPMSYRRTLGAHHDRFEGLKECAYLHPEVFSPDPSVRDELGVGEDEQYAIVRFNAHDSIHDVGHNSDVSTERMRLLDRLAEHVTVFVSDEGGSLDLSGHPVRTLDIHPARIHDVLAEARLVVTDTGTMATEASFVGTPAIRFVDGESTMGEFEELESEDLLVQHTDLESVLADSVRLLDSDGAQRRWRDRRDRYLASKPNLTRLLRQVAESKETARTPPDSEQLTTA